MSTTQEKNTKTKVGLLEHEKQIGNVSQACKDIEKAVIEIAIEFPAYGQERAANELKKRGILISASGIRSVWQRNDLENFKKRLKALEAKVAQDGIILNRRADNSSREGYGRKRGPWRN
ncbi:ISSod13 transposase [Trichonephila clavata]|uniref:ISSod13 transposase n=1 Tax=Trichonephila clavata TaxID=2740835 RepID=A0A8X6GRD1_TRICU|nr:ISSod13 transposase [Trichonephila clavata]